MTHLVTFLATCSLIPAASGQVVNSDFSARPQGDYDWAANWSVEKADRGAVYRLVDDDGHSGKDCLRYQCTQTRPAGAVTQGVACQENTEYVLEAWFKSDGSLRPAVVVTAEGESGREIARVVGDTVARWHRQRVSFHTGEAQKVRVMIYGDVTIRASGSAPMGFSAIDDVQITEASQIAVGNGRRAVPGASGAAENGTSGPDQWKAPGPNVALHKPYTFSRPPSYGLCADPDDPIQLTDGVYSVGYFWTQKSTVGWTSAGNSPIAVTIDLGQIEPIVGVSYNTAAGVAGVHWPQVLYLMTSDDAQTWFLTGDLVQLDTTTKEPPAPDVYATHRYATDRLATRGRYVMVVVQSDYYAFCDEIEVYRREGHLPEQAQGKPIANPLDYYWRGLRVESDLDTIADRLKKARLSAREREKAHQELESLRSQTGRAFPPPPPDTPATLPVNDVQARVFALNGVALRGLGLPPLFAWKKNRFDPLGPIEQPDSLPKATSAIRNPQSAIRNPQSAPSLTITAMNNEWRSDAIVLTNASGEPAQVRLRITGLPGGDNPPYLSLRDVPFVDSAPRVDVACALSEANREGPEYVVTIPAGMNRQVWVMAHPVNVAPGSYQGTLIVTRAASVRISDLGFGISESGNQSAIRNPQSAIRTASVPYGGRPLTLKVPLRLRISKVRFPDRPRLHLGGWDYTDAESCYDVVPTNRDRLVEYLKAHYVDTPWGGGGVLPMPAPEDFDADGKLTKELDFSRLDDWVRRWEGARVFLVFVNAAGEFAGVKRDTPQFAPRVASWIAAVAAHLKALGLRPDQFGLLIWDEPNSEEHAAVIRAWADAIHQAGTGLLVWEDPQYGEPQSEIIHQSLQACDVVSPFVPLFLRLDEAKRSVYRDLATDQRKLWFYDASGPVRALDPYSYHRLQEWLCFREGAEGSCFWAFGDAGGGSSWNERASGRGSGYAPQYLSKDSVTDSKHMLGIVEGVQDYEYLCLLRDRVRELEAQGVRSLALARAKELLQSAPRQVLAGLDSSPDTEMLWQSPKDRSLADRMRERILSALEALASPGKVVRGTAPVRASDLSHLTR